MSELYLVHHGIKGQKWGVRRYQNLDGTLTEEGKKRYEDFNKTTEDVKNKLSNSYSPFIKSDDDIKTVMSRGGVSEEDAKQCLGIANKKFEELSEIEPEITKDVVSAVSGTDSKMYGLEYRLKQPTSMAGKMAADSKEKDISFDDAANSIKDGIRYTAVSNEQNFSSGYSSIKGYLESLGYEEVKCKNYFEQYRNGEAMHKSVQSIFKDPNGNSFEIQFQTPSSQAAKELKIPLYEESRKITTSNERREELSSMMKDLAEKVKTPNGVYNIAQHGGYMSDNYLIHWAKGKEAKNHKYTAREWVNGAWQYVYGAIGGNAKQKYADSKKDYESYQSTMRSEAYKKQMNDAFNGSSKTYNNKSLAYKNQANWEAQRSRFYDNKANRAGTAYNEAASKDHNITDENAKKDFNDILSKYRNTEQESRGKSSYFDNKSKQSMSKAAQYKDRSANYQVAANKYKNDYDTTKATNEAKRNAVSQSENDWHKTPLYKMETAINAGKKFFSSLFKVR